MIKNFLNSVLKSHNLIITIISFLILWACLLITQVFLIEKSFTILTHNFGKDVFRVDGKNGTEVRKLSAEFISKDNYLGIVAINFEHNHKMLSGEMLFRLKERGSKEWYYQNTYNPMQLNDLSFFPFGFPIIPDSKNKYYIVEIELKKVDQHNTSLSLADYSAVLASQHQFPKAPLLENKYNFLAFLSKKITNIINNNYQIFGSVIFLYPLALYLIRKSSKSRLTSSCILVILILTILYDAVFINEFVDLAYLTIAILWILVAREFSNFSRLTFKLGFFLLSLSGLSHLLHNDISVEKFTSWAYIFFVTGTFLSMIELRKSS